MATMALSGVVSVLFDIEKSCDLALRVRGYSRLLKVIPLDRSGMVSY